MHGIIDFRARPNTSEYMAMYPSEGSTWAFFGRPKPRPVELEEFVLGLNDFEIAKAVFTGRQSVENGLIVRGVTNDYVAASMRRFSDRLVGFGCVDPRDSGAVAEVFRSVNELGLRGISFDPKASGVHADDSGMTAIYRAAVELGVPVVFTMGPRTGTYGDPMRIDAVARQFPELRIVCSHGCWPQVNEFVAIAYTHDHVYLEASLYWHLPGAGAFIEAMHTIIQDRVVYASAFPFGALSSYVQFQDMIEDRDVEDLVLRQNALRLLGLDSGVLTAEPVDS